MNFITKNYKDIKERLNIKKKTLLYEGLFLVIFSLLVYFFDLKIEDFTVLYLFPLALILLALKYLMIANNYKKLNMKNWIATLIESFIFLIITGYLVFNLIPTKEAFIIWLGSTVILKTITDILIYKKMHIGELIRFLLYIALGILMIIFNAVIVEKLYLYLVIIFFIIGISDLIEYLIIRKK